jgi:toxin-antitoxin system PIN domain toxin
MRALLDVNVLIALMDADHASHEAATAWFSRNARAGWASCAITQNGCVRVMSHPRYPNAQPVRVVADRLAEAVAHELHEFWPDDVSVLDPSVVDRTRIHGPQQLTDVYLLALAESHSGRLVTFDRSIALDAVPRASAHNLLRI